MKPGRIRKVPGYRKALSRLIARYFPEWTESNIHDPGVTLLELVTYSVNDITYRLDDDKSKNKLKRRRSK